MAHRTYADHTEKPLAALHDKTALPYVMPGVKLPVREWWLTWKSRELKAAIRFAKSTGDKRDLPKLLVANESQGVWTPARVTGGLVPPEEGSDYRPVILDFDKMFTDEEAALGAWDLFYARMVKRFRRRGIVFRTMSNKVKVIIVLHVPGNSGAIWTVDGIIEALEILGIRDDELVLDLGIGALTQTFIHPDLYRKLGRLSSLVPYTVPVEKLIGWSGFGDWESGAEDEGSLRLLVRDKGAHTYERHDGEIPESLLKHLNQVRERGKPSKELLDFIRILIHPASARLLTDGMGLPGPKLTRELGGADAAYLIAQLIEWRCLECVDHSYAVGKRAKRYRAIGELAAAMTEVGVKARHKLPETIPENGWWKTFFEHAKHIATFEEFTTWIESLPGWDDDGRYQKALDTWERIEKWREDQADA